MNILFMTITNFDGYPNGNLYFDLVNELKEKGHNVYVVCSSNETLPEKNQMSVVDGVTLLRDSSIKMTKNKSKISKGVATLSIEFKYKRLIKKYLNAIKFDLVITHTPPITFNNIIAEFKKENIPTYLLLKDIFPQNAVDLGMMKKKSLVYCYFRFKEKKLYSAVNYIGCMSQGNLDYLLSQNKLPENVVTEIFPNSIKIKENKNLELNDKKTLKNVGIEDKTVFIYGGNLGLPQGISFIENIIDSFELEKDKHLLIVGNGTEFKRLEKKSENKMNTTLISEMPKNEYDNLLKEADVGLIFLDNRFTIPNIPSRLNSYLENSLPVLAATDRQTDLKEIIENSKCGFWTESNNINQFMTYADKLSKNADLRNNYGKNGRNLIEKEFDIDKNIEIILKHFENGGS